MSKSQDLRDAAEWIETLSRSVLLLAEHVERLGGTSGHTEIMSGLLAEDKTAEVLRDYALRADLEQTVRAERAESFLRWANGRP